MFKDCVFAENFSSKDKIDLSVIAELASKVDTSLDIPGIFLYSNDKEKELNCKYYSENEFTNEKSASNEKFFFDTSLQY